MSVEPPRPTGERAVARLFGAMLMAVGGLVAVASGLCSAGMLAMSVVDVVKTHSSSGDLATMLPLVAIFGGVPFVFGLGVFFGGLGLWRGPRKTP